MGGYFNKITIYLFKYPPAKFPSVLRVIDRSDRNPQITATTGEEILETFPQVFCFPKSSITENDDKYQHMRNEALELPRPGLRTPVSILAAKCRLVKIICPALSIANLF